MVKENCRTMHFRARKFSPEQNQDITNTRFRKVYEIDWSRHKVLHQILLSTNNKDLRGEWKDDNANKMTNEEWENKFVIINQELIKLGIIIPG